MSATDHEAPRPQRVIDVTERGAMTYEERILSQVSDPAGSIARMEALQAAAGHPSLAAQRELQLEQYAQEIERAAALIHQAAKRYGLPPATMLRVGPRGVRLAARRLAEVA